MAFSKSVIILVRAVLLLVGDRKSIQHVKNMLLQFTKVPC